MNHFKYFRAFFILLMTSSMFQSFIFAQDFLLSNSHIDSTENLIRIEQSSPLWNTESVQIRISKSDRSGQLLWEHFLTTGAGSRVVDLTSDHQNRIYLAAVLKDQLSVAGDSFRDFKPGPNSALMMLDNDGQFLKLMTWSHTSQFRITDVKTSVHGEVWVSGERPWLEKASVQANTVLWFTLDATGAVNRVVELEQVSFQRTASSTKPREQQVREWIMPTTVRTKDSLSQEKTLQSLVYTDPIEPPTIEPPQDPSSNENEGPPP